MPLVSSLLEKVSIVNRKFLPSGRKTGQRCETFREGSNDLLVTGARPLPSEFIFHNQPAACGEKTITPVRLQLPPRPLVAVASGWGAPPESRCVARSPCWRRRLRRVTRMPACGHQAKGQDGSSPAGWG